MTHVNLSRNLYSFKEFSLDKCGSSLINILRLLLRRQLPHLQEVPPRDILPLEAAPFLLPHDVLVLLHGAPVPLHDAFLLIRDGPLLRRNVAAHHDGNLHDALPRGDLHGHSPLRDVRSYAPHGVPNDGFCFSHGRTARGQLHVHNHGRCGRNPHGSQRHELHRHDGEENDDDAPREFRQHGHHHVHSTALQ